MTKVVTRSESARLVVYLAALAVMALTLAPHHHGSKGFCHRHQSITHCHR